MKYCLNEEPGPKKQGYKDRFRSNCLFSIRAASQSLEILYIMEVLYKLMMSSALESVFVYDLSIFYMVRLVVVLMLA